LIGLGSQFAYNTHVILNNNHIDRHDVVNELTEVIPNQVPFFLGIAVYVFEGIGGVYNQRSAMKEPEKFPFILRIVNIILALMFIILSATSSMAIKKPVPDIILFSLPKQYSIVLFI